MEEKIVNTLVYPRPEVAVDCVMFCFDECRLKVLLIKRDNEPCLGKLALPGGVVHKGESCRVAAERMLETKTGLKQSSGSDGYYLEQLHTYSDPGRDERWVISVAYLALVKKQDVKGGKGAISADWYPLDEAQGYELAFDHNKILSMAIEDLRHRIYFEPIGMNILPKKFTMRKLQMLYEAILGTELERTNFTKKILGTEVLEKTEVPVTAEELDELDLVPRSSKGRKSPYYCFNEERYKKFKNPKDGKLFRMEF